MSLFFPMSVQVAVDWKRTHFHRCINAIKCSPKLGQINCKIIIAPGWRAAAKKMQRHFALLSSTVFLKLTKTVSLRYIISFEYFYSDAQYFSLSYTIYFSHSPNLFGPCHWHQVCKKAKNEKRNGLSPDCFDACWWKETQYRQLISIFIVSIYCCSLYYIQV